MYGITETTVHTTYKFLSKEDLLQRPISNIGTPLADMKIAIVDQSLNPVPIGIAGELLVGGNGLALGYLNKPEITAEKFIAYQQNLTTYGKDRFYRTGDLVRYLSNGDLEYLGRIDKQIKFNGYRIETEEVESAMLSFPNVAECIVTIKMSCNTQKLVAYYVVKQNDSAHPQSQDLKLFLSEIIPSYMIPSLFIKIDKIPLTENMKINYSALPSIENQLISPAPAVTELMTAPQKILAQIWKKNLYLTNIELDDNFFGIGGDSITSIKVVVDARDQGFSISVRDIFKYQTIREIVKHCWKGQKTESTSAKSLPFSLVNKEDLRNLPDDCVDAYPMSSLQLGMIYHTNYSPKLAIYLDIFRYTINAVYNEDYLFGSLQHLLNASPILRTTFHLSGYSTPMQIVHKTMPLDMIVINLSSLSEEEQNKTLTTWLEHQKTIPFDFTKGPLFRITIHLLSETVFDIGLSFHHSILDGWSVATFFTRLLAIYSDFQTEKQVNLEIDYNYREYIKLEINSLANNEHKNFWLNKLRDVQVNDISSWYLTQSENNGFDSFPVNISDKINIALTSLAKKLNVSLDIILLTALIKLLSILLNSDDVLLGVVFHGRPSLKDIDNTLGLFLNTVPFRQQMKNCSWNELILSVANEKSTLYPYRRYPLMQIQEDIQINKLFNILFYFTNFHVYNHIKDLNNIQIINQKFYERTNFPLTFNFSFDQLHSSLKFIVNYETKYYLHDQIESITNYFLRILSAIVFNSCSEHHKFDLLTAKEQQLLLMDWNKTDTTYNLNTSFYSLFENQVHHTPNNTALCDGITQLTYQDLSNLVNSLALGMQKFGPCSGDYITVYASRNIATVAAILAILKLGCVYVPIDIAHPFARLEYIVNEVNSKLICIDQSTSGPEISSKFSDKLFMLDNLYTKKCNTGITTKNYSYSAEDVAYVIYTSGSTGNPKGVMIRHFSLVNFLLCMKEKLKINGEDRLLALTSFSFDISLLEIFLPLISGATCIIAKQNENKDPRWIINAIKHYKVSCLQATPTTWKMLFDFGYQLDSNMKALAGGELLTPVVAQQLMVSSFAWNLYGPTETTIWSTHSHLTKSQHKRLPISIGKPIANTRVYVLNSQMKLVPIGVTGELFISGLGVAKGYLHQKQLSKEKFIENPFVSDNFQHATLYKTGDLVKWLPDGSLCYVGRTDYQFKLRGFRIEPGEIEAVLLKHKSITGCVVIVKKIQNTDSLVAFVALNLLTKNIREKELRTFLAKKLPHYMIPDRFVFLDAIPVNVSGKTDLKALSSIPLDNQLHSPLPEIPLTNEQQSLADIWSQVLNTKHINPDDNFFDLGGNSILSLIVLQKINQTYSINLSIRDLIEFPVLSELANKINSLSKDQDCSGTRRATHKFLKKIADPIVRLRAGGNKEPLFLIHPIGGTVFYYMPLAKRLRIDRPIYAIQDPGIESKSKLFDSLEEMVSFYIKAIKKYQPNGPYYIAGSSFGANAAVEMAHQLLNQKELVPFVGLLDGWVKYPDQANHDLNWFRNNLTKQLEQMKVFLPEFTDAKLFLDIHWHRQQLLVKYSLPGILDFSLTLFKAQETMDVLKPLDSPFNNWDKYCNIVPTTFIVPGDHFTMHFEPHVDRLAQVFSECLNFLTHQNARFK